MTSRFPGKYRRSTGFKVFFPTVPSLTAQPGRADLQQKMFEHDVLVLEYVRTSSRWFDTLKTGTPVTFSWSQDGRRSSWVGYVSHVSKDSTTQKKKMMKIVCVGASYVLKARAARVFKNSSVTDAAKKIANEFGLGFVGEPSSRKFDQLSMTGESYFSWLQKQAKRVGYGFIVRNATIFMRPLDKFINESASNATVMTMWGPSPAAGVEYLDRTADSFTVLHGDYLDGQDDLNTHKVTAGVNPLTGAQVTSTTSPNKTGKKIKATTKSAIFSDYTTEVVHSKPYSKQASKDLAAAAKLTLPAKLTGQGDPRLAPFRAVYLEGTGPSTDGYWVVKEVHHMFLYAGDYQVEMRVATDGLGKNANSPFRRTNATRVGTVNLEEKVLQDLTPKAFREAKPRLIKRAPIILESNQGFMNLGNVWSGK